MRDYTTGLRAAAERLAERFFDLVAAIWTSPFSDLEESRYPWRKCADCSSLHAGWHRCPNRLLGFCVSCDRKRLLNRFGMCPSGHTAIAWRTFRENDRRAPQEHHAREVRPQVAASSAGR